MFTTKLDHEKIEDGNFECEVQVGVPYDYYQEITPGNIQKITYLKDYATCTSWLPIEGAAFEYPFMYRWTPQLRQGEEMATG